MPKKQTKDIPQIDFGSQEIQSQVLRHVLHDQDMLEELPWLLMHFIGQWLTAEVLSEAPYISNQELTEMLETENNDCSLAEMLANTIDHEIRDTVSHPFGCGTDTVRKLAELLVSTGKIRIET